MWEINFFMRHLTIDSQTGNGDNIIIFQQFVNEDKRAFQPKEEVLNYQKENWRFTCQVFRKQLESKITVLS